MTKPKIANGNYLNPVTRLEKRFDEYKRCHQAANKNCNKIQESHNKSNDALRALLERKSKLSDNKTKKKRSAASTTVNRKKTKSIQEQLQSGNGFFENRVETTPNVTLNVHSSEIPDIDWDSFDILNNPNFSMSINEQELEGVLNSCYSQTVQSAEIKTVQNPSDNNLVNVCKTSPILKKDGAFIQQQTPVNSFKNEDTIFPPLFPPPENHSCSQQSVKYEYLSPQNYLPSASCNYNSTGNLVPSNSNQMEQQQQSTAFNSQNAMCSVNLPVANSSNNLSYQYNNTLVQDEIGSNTSHYFYQYPNYAAANEHATNSADNFQLPAMSSGWYNNVPGQSTKSANCKLPTMPQQQHFVNSSGSLGSYRNDYSQYPIAPHQEASQIHYQQMFINPQSYDPSHVTNANYAMVPEPQQYYYMDYSHINGRSNNGNPQSGNFINNNRSVVDHVDPRFIAHQTNSLLCRNVYQ